jgi:hypothetical protein
MKGIMLSKPFHSLDVVDPESMAKNIGINISDVSTSPKDASVYSKLVDENIEVLAPLNATIVTKESNIDGRSKLNSAPGCV